MLAFPVMKKLTGTVKRDDLEGGHWVLETADGQRYQLSGHTSGLKDGMKARVEGTVDKGVMGIGMTGPTLTVSKIESLD